MQSGCLDRIIFSILLKFMNFWLAKMHGNNVMFNEDTRYKNSNCDTLTGFLERGIMHASDFATLKRYNFICD